LLDEEPAMPNEVPDSIAPLKICMLAACPFPANHGTPGSIREMSEAMVELGHEVHIVTYHFGENIPVRGPTIHRIPAWTRETAIVVGPTSRRPLYDLQLVFKTLEVIARHRPHLLHAHGYEAAIAAALCRLLTGVPVVYSGHQIMRDELASYGAIRPRWLADALARLLDCMVPRTAARCLPHNTNLERFFYAQGLRSRTDPVVGFGIDLGTPVKADPQELRRQYGLGDRPVVVYTGVMDEFQRLDLLLGAIPQIARELPNARLLIIQTIHNAVHVESLRRLIAKLDIAERVIITEPQELAGVRELLSVADVAVVPRPQASGSPIKLINYMAARKPCVLFASSASQGLVHLENSYFARDDDCKSMAEAILALLKDENLRQRLALNGFQYVTEHHDRKTTARQVCATYLRTLHGAGRDTSRIARILNKDLAPAKIAATGLNSENSGSSSKR
jgi:1,2-diacylglycerol 3-alpha-glucosyltransferase